jgi:transcriptional regulator with XRE-family HTH domain
MTLGERIAARRTELGLRQIDLAEKAQVTCAAICQYENGVRVPNAYTFFSISKVLGVTMDELMTGNPGKAEART